MQSSLHRQPLFKLTAILLQRSVMILKVYRKLETMFCRPDATRQVFEVISLLGLIVSNNLAATQAHA